MTQTDFCLSSASTVAGYVWSLVAGVLMHGSCAPTGAIGDLGIILNSANFRPGIAP
jgi:hypothetical protein